MDYNFEKKRGFFKTYSYEITKLFINQVGITIFSLVLYTAAASIEDAALFSKVRTLLSAFAIIFFYALLYTAAWEFGAKDKIKVDGGKLEGFKLAGLRMGLIANLPNFILAFLASFCIGMYIATGSEGFYTAFGVFNLIIRFLSAMFLGVIQWIFSFLETDDVASMQYKLYFFWQSVGYFIVPAFTVAITHIGYLFGFKEKRIFKFLTPEKNKK